MAFKSLKIEYVVAWGVSLDILVQQMRGKKSYGFTAIWSHDFFFGQKCTKFDLALQEHIRNR